MHHPYENLQINVDGFSTYNALVTFLEWRIQTLEEAHTTTETGNMQGRRDGNTTSRSSNQ